MSISVNMGKILMDQFHPDVLTLDQIRTEPNPRYKIKELGTLLEYMLRDVRPGLKVMENEKCIIEHSEGRPPDFRQLVEFHRSLFSNPDSIHQARKIRNDLTHVEANQPPIRSDDLERGIQAMEEAVSEIHVYITA